MKQIEINEFIKRSKLKIEKYEAYYYGTKELADIILDDLLKQTKRATTGLLKEYEIEKEELPKVGDISIILNSLEEPKAITKITKVEIVKFKDISAEYAYIEGEGDRSLTYWKQVHKLCFTKICKEYNINFSEDDLCVCEYFDILYME